MPLQVLGILFAIGLTFVPIGIGCIVTSRSVRAVWQLRSTTVCVPPVVVVGSFDAEPSMSSKSKDGFVQVVMLSARYDHVCLEGVPSNATDAERDAALTRVRRNSSPPPPSPASVSDIGRAKASWKLGG